MFTFGAVNIQYKRVSHPQGVRSYVGTQLPITSAFLLALGDLTGVYRRWSRFPGPAKGDRAGREDGGMGAGAVVNDSTLW
jgi:hypothetical protein